MLRTPDDPGMDWNARPGMLSTVSSRIPNDRTVREFPYHSFMHGQCERCRAIQATLHQQRRDFDHWARRLIVRLPAF
jgi:hypothetical protein